MSTTLDALDPSILDRAAAVIKCLGHPLRLRILDALESGEKSVSELQTLCRATQASVSQQLGVLKGRDIVDFRRDGTSVYYWITEPKVSHILRCIRDCDLPS